MPKRGLFITKGNWHQSTIRFLVAKALEAHGLATQEVNFYTRIFLKEDSDRNFSSLQAWCKAH